LAYFKLLPGGTEINFWYLSEDIEIEPDITVVLVMRCLCFVV
jgi:hypothetical protein